LRNPRQHPTRPRFQIFHREPQNDYAFGRQPGGPSFIPLAGLVMHRAVNLNAQLHGRAVEVEDIRPHRMLPPEVQPSLIAPKQCPEQSLGLGHSAPQFLRSFADEIR
jgi:hypothetical protein